MKIKVIYFAIYSELLAKREESIDIEEGATVKNVFEQCTEGLSDRKKLLESTLFAVNDEYVDSTVLLQDGDELVFIPPVSGG